MNCYYCSNEITKENESEEHIILNSLGGKISSKKLICSACNKKLGGTIDTELYKQVGFIADIIGVNRDRKKTNIKVKLLDGSGEPKYVGKGLLPKPTLIIERSNQDKPITISAKDDKDLKKLANRKLKELEKKGEKGSFKEVIVEPDKTKYYLVNSLSRKSGEIGFGGKDFFRAIGKIALNFLLYTKPECGYSNQLIGYIKDEEDNKSIYFYYPIHYQPHELNQNEISHIIHLKGDSEIKILYSYIELFNTEKFIVIIDLDYSGEPFQETYCLGLMSNKELEKNIKIKLRRQHFIDISIISKQLRKNHEIAINNLAKKLEALQ